MNNRDMTFSHPEIQYDGPPEYAEAWDRFTHAYTKDRPYAVTGSNLLNQLAFGGAKNVLRKHCRTKADYKEARKLVMDCALALSQAAYENHNYIPLSNALIKNLMDQWVVLGKAAGIYSLPKLDNLTLSEREVVLATKSKLYESPAGSMIANAVYSLCHSVIETRLRAACRQLYRVDEALAKAAAEKVFQEALFEYEPGITSGFVSFLIYLEKIRLPKEINNTFQTEYLLRDYPDTISISTPGQNSVSTGLEDVETQAALRKRLLERLSDKERQIMTMRYGLGEAPEMQMKEIGAQFGVTGDRISQLHAAALQTLRENTPLPAPEKLGISNKPLPRRMLRTKKEEHSEGKGLER